MYRRPLGIPERNDSCAVCRGTIDYENAPEGLTERDVVLCSSCRDKAHELDKEQFSTKPDVVVRGAGAESGWQIGHM